MTPDVATLEADPRIRRLLDHGTRTGCAEWSRIEDVATVLSLADEARERLLDLIEAAGATIRDDCAKERPRRPSVGSAKLAELTTDTLEMFLQEIGRVPLLTADDDVELAKRTEEGDEHAKEPMTLANLRLVVHWAKRYQNQG